MSEKELVRNVCEEHGALNCSSCYIIADLEKENLELRALVSEAIELQKNNYGNGILTHVKLGDWAEKAEKYKQGDEG